MRNKPNAKKAVKQAEEIPQKTSEGIFRYVAKQFIKGGEKEVSKKELRKKFDPITENDLDREVNVLLEENKLFLLESKEKSREIWYGVNEEEAQKLFPAVPEAPSQPRGTEKSRRLTKGNAILSFSFSRCIDDI